MPSELGNLAVKISLDDSASPQLRAVEQSIRSFQSVGGNAGGPLESSLFRARESARLLSEEIGVKLPRSLSTVLAHSQILGPALAAAFSGVAAIGFIELLSRIPDAIKKIADKIYDIKAAEEYIKNQGVLNKHIEELNRQALQLDKTFALMGLKGVDRAKAELEWDQRQNQTLEQRIAGTKSLIAQNEIIAKQVKELATPSGPAGRLAPTVPGMAVPTDEAKTAQAEVRRLTEELNILQLTAKVAGKEVRNAVGEIKHGTATEDAERAIKNFDELMRLQKEAEASARKQTEQLKAAQGEAGRLGDAIEGKILSPWAMVVQKADEERGKVQQVIAEILKIPVGTRRENGMLYTSEQKAIDLVKLRSFYADTYKEEQVLFSKLDEDLAKAQESATQAINAIGSKELSGLGVPKAIIPSIGKPDVFTDDLAKKLHNLQTINEGLTTSFDNLFSGLASGTRSISQLFTGMADTVVAALGKIIAKMLVMVLMEKLAGLLTGAVAHTDIGANGPSNLQGGGLGSGGGSPFGGPLPISLTGHAAGGPVIPGVPYLVGERGPEPVIFGQRGMMYPNSAMGAAQPTVINRVNVINQSSQKVDAYASKPRMDIDGMVTDVILRDAESHGPVHQLYGGR